MKQKLSFKNGGMILKKKLKFNTKAKLSEI